MFCSSCGQKLDGVAHVVNNELLCQACFSKLGQTQSSPSQHTVFLSQVSEDERAAASHSIPGENVPEVNLPTSAAGVGSAPPASQPRPYFEAAFMLSGEQVLWKRTFSKGIIHREATLTEMITNLRALCVDDLQKTIVRAAPLGSATIAVTNTRRDYSNVHTGFERYGTYSGISRGSGVTIGDVQFFLSGRNVLTLTNVRDPFGVKRMIENSVRSSKDSMR